jgi:ABC-2 type transport system ATP-binding protein
MLYINGLKKSYKTLRVLTDLSMNLEKGDVYGFLGTNGCGKTTTMNIICNIIPKDEGDINFDNNNIKIGYLPESPSLYEYMNGYEYLNYIGACCRYENDINARTSEVLDITGMTFAADRLIGGYSRGMNQRIGIAAALYAHPDLLILDEPTSALDPEGRAEVMSIIGNLAASGSTIILCTHILADVERVANKIGILKDGTMAVEGLIPDVKKLFRSDNVLGVRLRDYNDGDVNALCNIELVEKRKVLNPGGVILYAKSGISEKELYNKVIETLKDNDILPEAIDFKRASLEQIYLGVTGGTLLPASQARAPDKEFSTDNTPSSVDDSAISKREED